MSKFSDFTVGLKPTSFAVRKVTANVTVNKEDILEGENTSKYLSTKSRFGKRWVKVWQPSPTNRLSKRLSREIDKQIENAVYGI